MDNEVATARGKRKNNNASTQRIKLFDNNRQFSFLCILYSDYKQTDWYTYAIDKNDNMVIFLFVLQQDQNILLIYLPS
jgi:hypothetical protein